MARTTRRMGSRAPHTRAAGRSFECPAEAWHLTWQALYLRGVGGRRPAQENREGSADDVLIALDRLWRRGRLRREHLLALRQCGDLALHGHGEPPDPTVLDEALAVLGRELAQRGLIDEAAAAT